MQSTKTEPQKANELEDKRGMEDGLKTLSNIEGDSPEKLKYPKRVFFIIGNEFCERFNYYGLSTILALYLENKLHYSETEATVLFHGFEMMVYLMCIFGGIISDVWLGKFRTILYLSIVYSLGSIVVSISAIPAIDLSPKVVLFIGLALIAIGSGGIKPCVAAFGGDQFKLPQQAAQLATFFSLFYFSINSGSLISTALTPILREDVHCFGDKDCFPLAFGLPAVLMFVSVGFFFIGRSSYTCVATKSQNMLVQVFKCVWHAISTKIREGRKNPRDNLLDYSIDKYGEQLVKDIRAVSKIFVLYLPLPVFWALFNQLGSRWTFQAESMNGDIGFYTIKPDQIQVVNPVLILVFIPLFETVIYPVLNIFGIRRPLQKMTIGGILAGVSFMITGLVQLKIEASPENTVNMLWLIPQYVVMTMAEVMFSVPGLAFSYDQAPESMKSVVQSIWNLTVAVGNLILLSIANSRIFTQQSSEFFLFGSLMFIDMLIFILLALNYEIGIGTIFAMIKKKICSK